jgi:uncharacterized membrane protein YidH (DUF202 family)
VVVPVTVMAIVIPIGIIIVVITVMKAAGAIRIIMIAITTITYAARQYQSNQNQYSPKNDSPIHGITPFLLFLII